MILVSFHGGKGDGAGASGGAAAGGYDNLIAYDDAGNELRRPVLNAKGMDLSELRGIHVVPNGYLWVASGGKRASAILCFQRSGSGLAWTGVSTVIEYAGKESPLLHPFDFTFDGQGFCYVSNQDTNTVARLKVSSDYTKATPASLPSTLPIGWFFDGTFVASSCGSLPSVHATQPVPLEAGLSVTVQRVHGRPKVTNSVRGVLTINGYLYVADEPEGVVKVYSLDGTYRGHSTHVKSPVHLLYTSGGLCVSSGSSIQYASLDPRSPASLAFKAVPSVNIDSVSGMAVDGAGTMYVGSRKANTCWTLRGFSPTTGPTHPPAQWPAKLPDNPEFLMYLAN